ncbi:transglycosylase SLT domain-containing protein [Mycobacterium simiae]|uniref:transglycosylase SLT domain-containing protein n=1 Tax=Mycobacterium simiae TaxID=1784 RepID=UPI0021CDBB62|nr:transglycosylase [Mycobacterium simiae]
MAGESLTSPLSAQAVAALSRGHGLFAGGVVEARIGDTSPQDNALPWRNLPVAVATRTAAAAELRRSTETDTELAQIVAAAHADHTHAFTATRAILVAARADAMPSVDTPLGRREAIVRMVARLRAQHRHIARSKARARLHALRLRRLHYLQTARRRRYGTMPTGRAAVLAAIQKALDIKGIRDPMARARWSRGMDLVARRESNYNANAVNRWDSNAAQGTPSKGAWQFIAPTFAAYHQPGTSTDIHDLVAQACAFINYARGHYGVAADASNLADRIQQADPRRTPRGY